MSTNAIEFQNVGLRYPVQRVPSLKEWGINLLTGRSSSREGFTALRDVTLDIVSGEATAIIGANGAGKSTLLRLAAGVIPPTSGEVVVRGRVAPLLELGTGFDLELSGRENILFNGALLGRTRSEMLRRFDEIVDFSGLENFIDVPLRTYSTGMISRLAFSIATSVDAEVVLIDEILSVGDAEFRVKCEERIRSYARSGATLVVVSHEMDSVRRLCTRAIWVGGGRLLASGDPEEVIATYERSLRPVVMEETASISRPAEIAGDLEISGIDPSFVPPGMATRVEVRGKFPGETPRVLLGDREVEVVNRSSKRLIIAVPALPAASALDLVVEIDESRGVMRRALVVAPEDVPIGHPFVRWIEAALRFDYMRPIEPGVFGGDRPSELNDVRHSLLHAVALREPDATDAAARVAAMKVLLDRFVRERGETSGGENLPLRRRDVAVLLLKAKHGPAYVPPPVEGIFADVNADDEDAPYLEQLYREKITAGCAASPLRCCPNDPTTRAQLAKFVVCAFE